MKALAVVLAALAVAGAIAWSLVFSGESSARRGVTGDLFVDVTGRSGVDFRFRGDLPDGKFIPTMGGGAALGDADGDGVLDLVLVNQVRNASRWRKAGRSQPLSDCTRLYRGRGDGTFEDVTERSGVRACGWGVSATFADLDADGDLEVLIGNAGEENTLWENVGGFSYRLVPRSGLGIGRFSIGVAVLDADADGVADVYVGHYVDTDPDRENAMKGTSFMTPDDYPGQDNALFRGLGGLRFADVTDGSGADDPGSKTIGTIAFDYDGDGRTDLYVANDQWRNTLLRNESEGGRIRFRDVSDETGTGYPQEGPTAFGRRTRSGMGLSAEDLDGDGWPDLFVTNFAEEPNTLYRNVEGVAFAQAERAAFGGDADPSLPLSGWGVVAVDADDDGRDDLVVSNGQILPRFFTVIAKWFSPNAKNFDIGERSYAQRQFLFRNESVPGRPLFRDISAEAGDLGRLVMVGRGLSAGDLDGDGRADLVFNPVDSRARVLRNGSRGGRSIEILPVPGDDRRSVLGTRLVVGERARSFHVVPSYASGSWLPVRFGLGEAASARVSVRWPDGSGQDLGVLAAGAYRLRKGEKPGPIRALPRDPAAGRLPPGVAAASR